MSKGPPGKPPAIHIEDEEDDDATEEANPGLTTAHEDSDNPAVEMVKASEEEDNPAVEMEKPSEEEDRPAVAMEKPSEEEDNPTLEGTAPEDDDPTLEGTLKKSKTPMLSIKSKKDEMSLDGSKKSPLTGDISGDLNFEEDIIIRLQKLRQQYETQKLSTKNTALETDQFLDESNINRIIKSVTDNILHHQTTDYEPKHKDPKRYDPEAFSQFTEAAYNIHNGVTVESEKNILTINVPDKGTITADFKKDEKKILFSCTDSSNQSLIILIETALKSAKTIKGKCNFVIYPNSDHESIAKLCAMANSVGLNPVFKESNPPGTPALKEFKEMMEGKYGTSDPKKITSSQLTIRDDSNLKPVYTKPPTPPAAPPEAPPPAAPPTTDNPAPPVAPPPAKHPKK